MATYTLKRKTFGFLGALGRAAVKHPITAGTLAVGTAGTAYLGAKGVSNAKDIATGNMGNDNGEGY